MGQFLSLGISTVKLVYFFSIASSDKLLLTLLFQIVIKWKYASISHTFWYLESKLVKHSYVFMCYEQCSLWKLKWSGHSSFSKKLRTRAWSVLKGCRVQLNYIQTHLCSLREHWLWGEVTLAVVWLCRTSAVQGINSMMLVRNSSS